MVIPSDQHVRPPLNNRGPSRDQPAPGSPRHIPAGSPEPGSHVIAVAVLEQQPSYERWERWGPNQWLHAGYRGATRAEPLVVEWAKVGICGRDTLHDLKDVSDRRPHWSDRETDRLPERLYAVTLDAEATREQLATLTNTCPGVAVSGGPGGKARLAFEYEASTLPAAVAAVSRFAESTGMRVTAIRA